MTDWHLRQATRRLTQGGIIAYPTEAVYGLGCDPLNFMAVTRLLVLKQRSWRHGLILIAAEFAQLQPFLAPLTALVQERVFATWPGPVTWLLPAKPEVPAWLRGDSAQLAVRVSAHPEVVALCRHWGQPLVSTSANLSGKPAATTALQVRRRLGLTIDYLLPGAVGERIRPSEIRDGLTNRILRM